MKKIGVYLIPFFLFFQNSLSAYSANPKDFVNELVTDAISKLSDKNLTNEDYQTRGFGSFGNDPRKFYVTEPYNQYGAPRVLGVSGKKSF